MTFQVSQVVTERKRCLLLEAIEEVCPEIQDRVDEEFMCMWPLSMGQEEKETKEEGTKETNTGSHERSQCGCSRGHKKEE